jgi:hypothetical protein
MSLAWVARQLVALVSLLDALWRSRGGGWLEAGFRGGREAARAAWSLFPFFDVVDH